MTHTVNVVRRAVLRLNMDPPVREQRQRTTPPPGCPLTASRPTRVSGHLPAAPALARADVGVRRRVASEAARALVPSVATSVAVVTNVSRRDRCALRMDSPP